MKYNPPEHKEKTYNRHHSQVNFCDCHDHDFRVAVRKLAQIMDMQPINDLVRTTASMYVKTANEIDQYRYVKSLEERLAQAELQINDLLR